MRKLWKNGVIRTNMRIIIMLAVLVVSMLIVDFIVTLEASILPVHNTNTGLDYATIQDAIDAPETLEGHTIKADAEIYHERVRIYKNNLTLLGKNPKTTVIDSEGIGEVIFITANNIHLSGFTIQNGYCGIDLQYSTNNTLVGNKITNNWRGIYLGYSCNNILIRNTIANNSEYGILASYSSSNLVYHNNFINNTAQVYNEMSNSTWDNGYPSGGNYWNDYTGVDLYSGPYQNETGSDGIGDNPCVIDDNNQDRYPLMNPWLLGDLGGGLPPQFFKFDGKVDGIDLALFIQCYKKLAPPEAMYLGDLGGPVNYVPTFFAYDGKVNAYDLALFIQCYKGLGP